MLYFFLFKHGQRYRIAEEAWKRYVIVLELKKHITRRNFRQCWPYVTMFLNRN